MCIARETYKNVGKKIIHKTFLKRKERSKYIHK